MQTTSLSDAEIHIWQIDLDRQKQYSPNLFSPDETNRAMRLKQKLDHKRFIHTRGAMRTILSSYLGVSGEVLRFGIGEKGKPYLASPDTGLEFNLSHCENIALLVVTKNIQIGVDIERIKAKPLQLKIAKRMFPEFVYTELAAVPAKQQSEVFFRYWTELEARAKCLGEGIFSLGDNHHHTQITHFAPKPGWIACVATMQQDTDSMNIQHHNFGS